MRFVYLLQARNATFPHHILITWEEPFRDSLYSSSYKNLVMISAKPRRCCSETQEGPREPSGRRESSPFRHAPHGCKSRRIFNQINVSPEAIWGRPSFSEYGGREVAICKRKLPSEGCSCKDLQRVDLMSWPFLPAR